VRVFAATWLVFQVAWVIALVPRDCCAAHRPAEASCHSSTAAAPRPMRADDSTPSPMHRGRAGHSGRQAVPAEHDHQPVAADNRQPSVDCRLAGVCDGPMAALVALLATHGILPDSMAAQPNGEIRPIPAAVREHLAGHFEAFDPPPPRA
jgi:hypothetical protein